MNENVVLEYWNKGPCPYAKQADDIADRFINRTDVSLTKDEIVEDIKSAFAAGLTGSSLESSKVLDKIDATFSRKYDYYYHNFYELGKDAADEIKRNTYDAKYEINDEYDIGIQNGKDPDKAVIIFLYKDGKKAGYSYYAKTLADHKPDVGLYLDVGRDIKIDGKSMNEVTRIAKIYAGIPDESEDYGDEAAFLKQTQDLYDAGEIDDDEYERRLDFIL